MAAPVLPVEGAGEDSEVACRIDWDRRFDHMQQHSGQHLLSAVFDERFALPTVSFHLGQESSTIDLDAAALDTAMLLEAERRANQVVFENRPIAVDFEDCRRGPRAAQALASVPAFCALSRSTGLDRSACGGTHVRRTGEIGPVLIRKLDKIRNTVRVEFLCGGRAVRRARADYDALARVAQMFSGAARRSAGSWYAASSKPRAPAIKCGASWRRIWPSTRAAELYAATAPDETGVRRVGAAAGTRQPGGVARAGPEFHRAIEGDVYRGARASRPALLLAVSADAGVDAGKLLKAALAAVGGRGGGNPRMAQGSVPTREALEQTIERIRKF